MTRPLGIEEELLLVDPATGLAAPDAPRVLKALHEHGPATDAIDRELFRHQVETRTDPTRSADDALAQVVAARRTAGEAAGAAGLATVACGFVPLGGHRDAVTADDRYRDMVDTFGAVARDGGGTCGMHVHVEVASDDEGVGVLDRVRPWLPLLLAISANSPYADGHDTGHASWRAQAWGRWPSAGATEAFGSVETYRAVCRDMVASGAARDPGMLYFDARLSAEQPTVEVRVADTCTDPADAVLVAVLARGLVETAAASWAAGDPAPAWRAELLRAAAWRAARYGTADRLVHPLDRGLRPAREALEALVDHVGPALQEAGDLDLARRGVDRVLEASGASRQRAAYERTGSVEGVVADLVARTEASWDAPDTAPRH